MSCGITFIILNSDDDGQGFKHLINWTKKKNADVSTCSIINHAEGVFFFKFSMWYVIIVLPSCACCLLGLVTPITMPQICSSCIVQLSLTGRESLRSLRTFISPDISLFYLLIKMPGTIRTQNSCSDELRLLLFCLQNYSELEYPNFTKLVI